MLAQIQFPTHIAGTVTESGSQNWCRQCGQQIAEDEMKMAALDDKLFCDVMDG